MRSKSNSVRQAISPPPYRPAQDDRLEDWIACAAGSCLRRRCDAGSAAVVTTYESGRHFQVALKDNADSYYSFGIDGTTNTLAYSGNGALDSLFDDGEQICFAYWSNYLAPFAGAQFRTGYTSARSAAIACAFIRAWPPT